VNPVQIIRRFFASLLGLVMLVNCDKVSGHLFCGN